MIYDATVTPSEIASLLRPYIEPREEILTGVATYVSLLRKWIAWRDNP